MNKRYHKAIKSCLFQYLKKSVHYSTLGLLNTKFFLLVMGCAVLSLTKTRVVERILDSYANPRLRLGFA